MVIAIATRGLLGGWLKTTDIAPNPPSNEPQPRLPAQRTVCNLLIHFHLVLEYQSERFGKRPAFAAAGYTGHGHLHRGGQ
jgi:hypothetical protein